jgi:aminoglycoside phosphotransferase family enzyme/predicted kinase
VKVVNIVPVETAENLEYPAGPEPGRDEPFAVLHETHSAVVLLYGDRAYKIKKPVVTDFLNFATLPLREQAVARELDLNRRLSSDVYLGVGRFIPPGGGPAEPVLVMRRLPGTARLTTLLDDPGTARTTLSDLARLLADFHDAAARGPQIDAAGTVAALRNRWKLLWDGCATAPLGPTVTDRVRTAATRYLDGRETLFDDRIAQHRIVDGHGDLQADDIFRLPDGLRVLDCLDFDDNLRYVDRLDDIAFLAMDLEFRGHPDLAAWFVAQYHALTSDPAPVSLHHHYLAYRATVRAKVECIRHRQGDGDAAQRARRYASIALRHLADGTIRLALVGGLPGTGKTTIAARLAQDTGAILLSSDHIRIGLRTTGAVTGESGTFATGAYSPQAADHVYTTMLGEARDHLARGRSVVLDASWIDAAQRARAVTLAEQTGTEILEFSCHAPQSVATERIAARHGGESEATAQIAAAMGEIADPWPRATVLDTTEPPAETAAAALHAWAAAGTDAVLRPSAIPD